MSTSTFLAKQDTKTQLTHTGVNNPSSSFHHVIMIKRNYYNIYITSFNFLYIIEETVKLFSSPQHNFPPYTLPPPPPPLWAPSHTGEASSMTHLLVTWGESHGVRLIGGRWLRWPVGMSEGGGCGDKTDWGRNGCQGEVALEEWGVIMLEVEWYPLPLYVARQRDKHRQHSIPHVTQARTPHVSW